MPPLNPAILRKPSLIDWLTLAGLVAAWGSSFVMTKVAVTHLDASWIMALRLAIAGIVLLAVLLISGRRLPRNWALWRWFAVLGLVGHAVPFFLISWGTAYTTSGLSGVLMGSIPLFVILAAHVALPDERMTGKKALGFVIGFAGLLAVIGPGALAAGTGASLKGELAILLGCLAYAAHGILARRIPYEGPLEQSTAVCLAGGAMGLVFATIVAPGGLPGLPGQAWLSVLGLGLVPTAVATLLMYRITRSVGVSFVAYSNYLVPVYALAFGAALLGETLSWNIASGLCLILAGIAVSRMAAGEPKP